jgi:hypothetical protein
MQSRSPATSMVKRCAAIDAEVVGKGLDGKGWYGDQYYGRSTAALFFDVGRRKDAARCCPLRRRMFLATAVCYGQASRGRLGDVETFGYFEEEEEGKEEEEEEEEEERGKS